MRPMLPPQPGIRTEAFANGRAVSVDNRVGLGPVEMQTLAPSHQSDETDVSQHQMYGSKNTYWWPTKQGLL